MKTELQMAPASVPFVETKSNGRNAPITHSAPQRRTSPVQPVIVIGMHRSGTTMITDLLEKLGLYMGWVLQENSEALFFVERNEKLMNVCGGSWEQPAMVDPLLRTPQLRAALTGQLWSDLNSSRFLSYLGPQKFLKYRHAQNIDFAWGWKDPRNTFLLPLWLDLFPQAKVVHVYRNGIDVACSLQKRETRVISEQARRASNKLGLGERFNRRLHQIREESPLLYTYRRLGSARQRAVPLQAYDRFAVTSTSNLETGFDLWCQYVRRCHKLMQEVSNPCVSIQYEDFLNNPQAHLPSLAKFCGLAAEPAQVNALCKELRPERRYAFKSNPEAVALYAKVRETEWMQHFGYSNI